jgi:integrase
MKLTAKNVRELPLPGGKSDHIEWDDDVPGFGLRIRSGSRSVSRVLIYQYGRTPTRRMKLGAVGAVDFETARRSAKDFYHRVQLGQDPAGERAEAKAKTGETFKAVLEIYLKWKRAQVRASTMTEIERHLLIYAKPLHPLPLVKIERRQLAAMLAQLVQNNGAVTANRVRATVSAFFSWAIGEGIIDTNAVSGTNRQDEKPRDRVLSADELRSMWNALPENNFGGIMKLLVLTGARADEIAGLRWEEVRDNRIELPKIRTKNNRPHTIPLSEPAQAVIAAQPRHSDEFVFVSLTGRPFRSWARCKILLDEAIAKAGGKPLNHWTIHDLRRTAATMMAEIDIQPHIIEAVLNHVSGHKAGVAGIYNRASYETEKRTALARWAEHVSAIVEGRETNVVTLRHA